MIAHRSLQQRARLLTFFTTLAATLWLAGCSLSVGEPAIVSSTLASTAVPPGATDETAAPSATEGTISPPATEAPAVTATLPPTMTPRPTETLPPSATPAPPTETPTPTPTYGTHTVDGGETLGGIAVRYGVTVDEIVAINDLADRNLVLPGQVLNIPPRLAPPTLVPFPDRNYGYAIAGYSAEGRAIEVFSFGEGAENVLFVGGIHGGYEWNTVLLAYEIMDYYNGNRDQIPAAVTLNVIPVANPDGLFRVTGREGRFFAEQVAQETRPGRFNGNNVDLNRNFSCSWSPSATWGRTVVSPGSAPFSEPETQALRDLITTMGPRFVVFWHSAANLVSPGTCGGEDAGAGELAQVYGIAANYPWGPFSAYDVTGGGSDWVVSLGIPAFAVELITHNSPETGRNLAGVQAMLDLFWEEGERAEEEAAE